MRWSIFLLILSVTTACGGTAHHQSSQKTRASKGTGTASMTPDFTAHLRSKIAERASSKALVTFAIFGQNEFADQDAVSKAFEGALRKPMDPRSGLVSPALRPKQWPSVVVSPVDGNLPLNLGALMEGAGPLAKRIGDSSHVAFIRYAGVRLEGEMHVMQSAWATAALATGANHVILDVSTRQTFDARTWIKSLSDEDWLHHQVVPGAEQDDTGLITFFTRGMAKFALPDLETSGVQKQEARGRFERFLLDIAAIREEKTAKVGQKLGIRILQACRRAPEAIEQDCVAID